MANEPTIDQMNEVIAIFDGWEKYEERQGIWFKKEGLIKCLHPKLQELRYHSSWDALMMIVEKIPKLIHAESDMDMRRLMSGRWKPIANELCNVNITNVHYCVYQFIKWYNQQSKMTLQVKNKADGKVYPVHKYILSPDGIESVWCNDWYGHHRIGFDCEWATHDRAKVLVDALEGLLQWHTQPNNLPTEGLDRRLEAARKALEQWERKEVGE